MKKQIDMCSGPLLGNILWYTVPIILTGVLQLLFNAADLVVVGQFSGSLSVAAVGATGSLTTLIVNLFVGLSVGVGVLVAQSIGGNRTQDITFTVHTAIPLAMISGLALTVIGVVGTPQFLRWMSTPDDVLPLSTTYMQIYFLGMIPTMLYNFGAAILRAAGDSKGPLYYLTLAGVVNVVLNLIFVVCFHMDVAGVALATILSQCLSAVLVVRALRRRTDACHLEWREMHIHSRHFGQIVRIGLPAGIQGSLFSISNVLIQSSVNSFGSLVMSGNAAASNLEGFVYMAMNAFSQTAMNFVGQNMGAGRYDRVRRILWLCLGSVTVTGLVMGVGAYALGNPLLSIYISDSPQAITYGLIRMLYICVPYFLCGLMDVATGAIRGMGASIAPMLVTVLGVCGMRVVWIYTIFRQHHTLEILFLSYPISWVLTWAVEMIVFGWLLRRRIRQVKQLEAEHACG